MKKLLYLIGFSLIINACQKQVLEINNLNNNKISVLGHGGMGINSTYPMNSFESIQKCLSQGADGTEIDIQMTKDNVLVLFHDRDLSDASNLSGKIYEQTWDEIQTAQYKLPPYTNYNIIPLDDLFMNLDNPNDYTFFLDCKTFNPDNSAGYIDTYINTLSTLIDKHNLSDNIYIELKREDFIQSFTSQHPNLNIFIYASLEQAFELAETYNLKGITIPINELSNADVQAAHNKGLMVATFNTHTKARNRTAIERNVDFIQTDLLNHLLRHLD